MGGSIICGVDGSASAQGAARVARDLSEKAGTSMIVGSQIPRSSLLGSDGGKAGGIVRFDLDFHRAES